MLGVKLEQTYREIHKDIQLRGRLELVNHSKQTIYDVICKAQLSPKLNHFNRVLIYHLGKSFETGDFGYLTFVKAKVVITVFAYHIQDQLLSAQNQLKSIVNYELKYFIVVNQVYLRNITFGPLLQRVNNVENVLYEHYAKIVFLHQNDFRALLDIIPRDCNYSVEETIVLFKLYNFLVD